MGERETERGQGGGDGERHEGERDSGQGWASTFRLGPAAASTPRKGKLTSGSRGKPST